MIVGVSIGVSEPSCGIDHHSGDVSPWEPSCGVDHHSLLGGVLDPSSGSEFQGFSGGGSSGFSGFSGFFVGNGTFALTSPYRSLVDTFS
jgi:hypothetical protein